jgi:tetratricopeptide (TPR) repeat protein
MPEPADRLARGREAHARRAWRQAYEALVLADQTAPLGAADLELLATSAVLLGRDDEYLSLLERAHQVHLDSGETRRAVRCAFWIGTFSAVRGETARATGWFGRAHRLLEREEGDCVERGYLLVTAMMEQEEAGDYEAAVATTVTAVEIGERFGDADLVALAMFDQGRILAEQGRIEAGLELLDEVMVAVGTRELSPVVTGLLYCAAIEGCQQAYQLRRAREWTNALTRWCEEQPELVSFTGRCLVHRAEIMQVEGAWPGALEEARRAGERFAQMLNRVATGEAHYRQGEIHRLRGERSAAEMAYREASRCGWEPQPGLALLRMEQGDTKAAAAAIRRLVAETA